MPDHDRVLAIREAVKSRAQKGERPVLSMRDDSMSLTAYGKRVYRMKQLFKDD